MARSKAGNPAVFKGSRKASAVKPQAPKSSPQGPNVFVVPELMAGEPVEPGGLLKEHLESERVRGPISVRGRMEAYLRDTGVVRKLPGEVWPTAAELAGMSGIERQRWCTLDAQHWIDSSLKKILNGKAPREVFKLDLGKHTRPTSAARSRNMCAEVLRLVERCDYTKAEAIERVAGAFSVSVRMVEQAAGLWGWDAAGKKERHRFVPLWEQRLRTAGKLR